MLQVEPSAQRGGHERGCWCHSTGKVSISNVFAQRRPDHGLYGFDKLAGTIDCSMPLATLAGTPGIFLFRGGRPAAMRMVTFGAPSLSIAPVVACDATIVSIKSIIHEHKIEKALGHFRC